MRVAVTGLGCITPIGNTVEAFREAMYAGRSGIREFAREFPGAVSTDPGLRFRTTALVKDLDPTSDLSSSTLAATDRSAQFGILAAQQAVSDSDLLSRHDPAAIAVITGCACGGRAADEEANRELYIRNARVPPTVILRTMASSGASHIATQFGVTGPVLNLATACASGTHAIGLAFQMVRSGMASAAIAGGHEAPLTFGFLRAWDSMRVVSPTACRPFSADRDGMTLGEGAAMLVLEPLDAAVARGVHVYAEVIGFGMSADAHHVTQPRAEGAALAMTRALEDSRQAGIEDVAGRVGYVNAHGTGTLTNDAIEAEAIHKALGAAAVQAPIGSTKSLTGHGIGAAGALEALATVLAMNAGRLPHTAGVTDVDSSLKLDVLVNEPREIDAKRDIALSNSLAFGGLNAVLAFRRLVP
jgi:3-oxoacyl-[acyl-carrier-protein] synthase II/nodulation protein E